MNHPVSRFRPLILFVAIVVLLAGCSIIDPPERPALPTPASTIPPLAVNNDPEAFTAPLNPTTTTLPDIDPDIQALLAAVSTQQLTAYVQRLGDFGTRNSFSDTQSDTQGIGAARRWIYSEFERVGGARMQVNFEDFTLTYEGLTANERNIVAVLPGVSSYSGSVVIGAHYDSRVGEATDGTSRSPSADDNASGIAMLLELARLMSSRNWNQTIIFVAFASEEQQTAGSRRFVTNAVLQGRQIDFMINNDTIGGRAGIPQSVRMYAPRMEDSPSGQVARYINFINQVYQSNFPIEMYNALDRTDSRGVQRYGDQREFINAGIGAVRFIESRENEDLVNSPTDTWDKLDYNYLAGVTRINLATIANWAGAPPPPQPPTIAAVAEEGTYLFTWPVSLDAAGYAFSFRPFGQLDMPELSYVSSDLAGNIRLNGFDPDTIYAVSLSAVGPTGRLSGFSEEILFQPR